MGKGPTDVLHGESITDQASPRTPTQRTFQPQEAVQPTPNHTPSRHSCAKGKLPLQPSNLCVVLWGMKLQLWGLYCIACTRRTAQRRPLTSDSCRGVAAMMHPMYSHTMSTAEIRTCLRVINVNIPRRACISSTTCSRAVACTDARS